MKGRADAILDGGNCEHGLESTIVRVEDEVVTVLREGAITQEMIRQALPGFEVGAVAAAAGTAAADGRETPGPGTAAADEPGPAPAPGMRHAHYRPQARVVPAAVEDLPAVFAKLGGTRVGYIGVHPLIGMHATAPAVSVIAADLEDYARRLYRSFYLFDREGCDVIVAELPRASGIGRALRDRLTRAAG
jgi:L-threonylcarbamoyladenylate synthase